MEIRIQSPQFKVRTELHDLIAQKLKTLEHMKPGIQAADVSLKLDNSSTDENKLCEIKLVIPGADHFAKRQCRTFEEAVTECVHALHNQLSKQKEKQG